MRCGGTPLWEPLYARTANPTDMTWSAPVQVPSIVGRRVLDAQTGVETITAPREMRLVADAANNVYAFWYDSDDQLFSLVNTGSGWSEPQPLPRKPCNSRRCPVPAINCI